LSAQTHFFATASDLLPVTNEAESLMSVQYVLTGLFESADLIAYRTASDLPDFGIASAGDANHLPQYLVAPASVRIAVRTVSQKKGGTRYAVDQLENPETIVFAPGGIYDNVAVIAGRIGSVHTNDVAKALLNAFSRDVKKFRRVGSYFVGPEAELLWQAGYRLTASVGSPREYDLADA
jgi:hypothetical protein